MRPELEPLSVRMRALPVDARGFPVPFFVQWIDGAPEFRLMDRAKYVRALREHLCWVCGQPRGRYHTFLIGPMCAVNRVSSEPPSHRECAEWSARNCPFLSRPQMVRREDARTEGAAFVGGTGIRRNPGVALAWTTRVFRLFRDQEGKPLLELGAPTAVSWWREGRPATRAEVVASIEAGLPALVALADQEGREALQALATMVVEAYQHLPADGPTAARDRDDLTIEDTTRLLAAAAASRPA